MKFQFTNGRTHLYCKQSHLTKPTDGCTKFQCQNALKNLGVCHEFGQGTTKNYTEARHLYERALAQGHTAAAEYLKQLDEKIRTECPLLGKRVVITGTSREDLNGRAGKATSFDHDRDRYVVELDDDTDATQGKGKLSLKPGNLVVLVERKGNSE